VTPDQALQMMMHLKKYHQPGEPPPQAEPPNPCTSFSQEEVRPAYQHLKSVNFYLDFPKDLNQALECSGHEEECVKKDGTISGSNHIAPAELARFIRDQTNHLKKLNRDYPSVLYPNSISNMARPLIKSAFAPVLPHDSSCKIPELTMLNPDSRYTYAATAGAPDVLNLIIRVTLVSTTAPHIVVLNFTTIRQSLPLYLQTPGYTTAIPLTSGDGDAAKHLQELLSGIIMQTFRPTAQGTEHTR
jgi:hypothetical protein